MNRLRPLAQESAAWEIVSESGTACNARALILACGRWWALGGIASPAAENRNEAAGPWMGAKAHFSDVAPRDAVEMYYFPGGYCGVAPVEDGVYNVCCLVHRGVVRNQRATRESHLDDFAAWLAEVALHPVLAARLRGATQVTSTISTAPLRAARRRAILPGENGVLIAGDAAGFLDPFTGDGISMALHSGQLAAAELAKALSNAEVDSRLRGNDVQGRQTVNFAQAAASYSRQLNRAVRRSYWVAGLLRGLVLGSGASPIFRLDIAGTNGARLHAETRWRESVESRVE